MTLSPINSIPGPLFRAVSSSAGYRSRAEGLLARTNQLDGLLGQAVIAEPTSHGEAYRFDASRYDQREGHPLFCAIRREKEAIERDFPLLFNVAELSDYVCHMATNFLMNVDRAPRTIALVGPEPEREIRYHNAEKGGFETSLAAYMGLSPFPVFGVNIDYTRPQTVDAFRHFGFGVFTYLNLILNPNVAWSQGLPSSFHHDFLERPVAGARILRDTSGSVMILPAALSRSRPPKPASRP